MMSVLWTDREQIGFKAAGQFAISFQAAVCCDYQDQAHLLRF